MVFHFDPHPVDFKIKLFVFWQTKYPVQKRNRMPFIWQGNYGQGIFGWLHGSTMIYLCPAKTTKGGCSGQWWGVQHGRCRCHNLNMATWGDVDVLENWHRTMGNLIRWQPWHHGKLHQGFDGVLGSWNPRSWQRTLESWWLDASWFGQPSRWSNEDLVLPHIQSTFQYFVIGNMMLSHFFLSWLFIGVSSFVTSPNSIWFEFLLVNPLLKKNISKSWLW